MKIKVKFKVVTYRGKTKTITRTIETGQEFKSSTSDAKEFKKIANLTDEQIDILKERGFFKTEAIELADNWVTEEFDKAKFILDNDLSCILDWQVVRVGTPVAAAPIQVYALVDNKIKEIAVPNKRTSEEKKQSEVLFTIDRLHKDGVLSDELLIDAIAVYVEMQNTIKTLSANNQISIIIASLGVAYKASSATLDKLAQSDAERKVLWARGKEKYKDYPGAYISYMKEDPEFSELFDKHDNSKLIKE